MAEIPAEPEATVAVEPEPEVLFAPGTEKRHPEPATEPTGAHDMASELGTGEEQIVVIEPDPEPESESESEPEVKLETEERADDDAPKWRFGKKSR